MKRMLLIGLVSLGFIPFHWQEEKGVEFYRLTGSAHFWQIQREVKGEDTIWRFDSPRLRELKSVIDDTLKNIAQNVIEDNTR